jgi:geranylgeranyl reductase family protein
MQRSLDVIVVGAGPSGSYAARGLARLGYEVLVLEEHERVGVPAHCTGIISTDACRQLSLDSTLVEASLSGARLFSPRGQSFSVSAPEPRAVVLDRSRFDQWLCGQAAASGAKLRLSTRARDVSVSDGRAVVTADVGGEPTSFQCALAIVATGANSSLVCRGNPSRTGSTSLYAAQIEAKRTGLTDVEVYIGSHMAPGGFAWAVPVDGKCRVGMISRQPPGASLDRLAGTLEERGAIARDGARVAHHRIPSGPLTPSFSDRILMVGDAAGQVKTTTGGGLYFGLIGAQAAVETAHRALRAGDLSAAALSRYEKIWQSRLGPEQRLGHLLRTMQAALSDEDLEFLFSLTRRTSIGGLLSRLHFDWHSVGLLRLLGDLVLGH